MTTMAHLRKHFFQYFLFEAVVMLLTTSLILPQFLRLYQWSLLRTGMSYALNAAVLYPSLASIRFWIMLGGFALFGLLLLFEYMILTILIHANLVCQPLSVFDAVRISGRLLKRLLLPGLFHLLTLGVLFVPMFMTSSGFRPVNLPLMLFEFVMDLQKLNAIWVIALMLWLYLHVHSLYIFCYALLYETGLTAAVKHSFSMIRKQQLWTFLRWLPVMLSMVVMWFLLTLTVENTAQWVSSLTLLAQVKRGILYGLSVGIYGAILLGLPFLVTYLLLMFRDALVKEGKSLPFPGWMTSFDKKQPSPTQERIAQVYDKHRHRVQILLTVGFVLLIGLNYLFVEALTSGHILIAAHRGDSGSERENSLESIQSAIDKQVDCVELDVMMTGDGVLVLHHDQTLRRFTGMNLRVSEVPYAYIQTLDRQIPTLEDALNLCRDQVYVILDIKDFGLSDAMMPKIVHMLETEDMIGSVYVQAFNPEVLQQTRALNPDIRLGQILYMAAGDLSRLDVDFYTVRETMLTKEFVSRAKELDRGVWVWTVNAIPNLREVMKYDIEGVITKYPARAQWVRSGLAR